MGRNILCFVLLKSVRKLQGQTQVSALKCSDKLPVGATPCGCPEFCIGSMGFGLPGLKAKK